MAIKRFLKHLITTRGAAERAFPPATMDAIEHAIREVESRHRGEIRFVVEGALDMGPLWQQQSPRERALEVFALQRVWDTPDNNGILLYVLMADHAVEIVCDRGIHSRVGDGTWQAVCHDIESAFRQGRYKDGVIAGITALGATLERHYPGAARANELSDRPQIL
ncbi:MAG: TPM domain-containing protein [Pigmentiphaga sp.]|uniref:TPM domain-containing protein n=1 Tax=Pigmentiphaga sp. TaxID=1977564 RepID=UPI0029B610D1|nr:TPM domain-containing protein [Pigmentiphaga sp.]MDX3905458.1 TPM domain-containing protein [Pigmentiphaga sp.]